MINNKDINIVGYLKSELSDTDSSELQPSFLSIEEKPSRSAMIGTLDIERGREGRGGGN